MSLFNLVYVIFWIQLIYLIHLVLFNFLHLFMFSIYLNSLDFLAFWDNFLFIEFEQREK